MSPSAPAPRICLFVFLPLVNEREEDGLVAFLHDMLYKLA